ncbi:MAG: hypothetical protein IPP46_16030 [Bacteroidetes bacterium]|nr:hypothetical protein [Bacteroidota bacterium]
MLEDVYHTYLERGRQHTTRKDFRKALDDLESAKRICNKYTQVRCSEELTEGFAAAKKGIYNEYIDEARDFIILNDLNRAERSAGDAIQFQMENKTYLRDASEAQAVLKGIRQKTIRSSTAKGASLHRSKNVRCRFILLSNGRQPPGCSGTY